MYSDDDLHEAATAGVVTPDSVAALRAHVAARRHTARIDEEHYRILDGSNDVLVMVAGVLVMAGLANIGWLIGHVVASVAVAGVAWGLAEYFVRTKRLTLTGIVLSLAFFGGVIATFVLAVSEAHPDWGSRGYAAAAATGFLISTGASWLFWSRFRVPYAMSFVPLSATGFIVALAAFLLIGEQTYNPFSVLAPVALFCGIGVFAYAMHWDLSDRERVTDRHEVAFWIHGTAATLIAQSLFSVIGIASPTFYFITTGQVLTAVIAYLLFAIIALVVDRRALLFAGLAVLVFTLSAMFVQSGAYSAALGLAAIVAGGGLLLLSAFWPNARAAIMPMLGGLADRLPPVAGDDTV